MEAPLTFQDEVLKQCVMDFELLESTLRHFESTGQGSRPLHSALRELLARVRSEALLRLYYISRFCEDDKDVVLSLEGEHVVAYRAGELTGRVPSITVRDQVSH